MNVLFLALTVLSLLSAILLGQYFVRPTSKNKKQDGFSPRPEKNKTNDIISLYILAKKNTFAGYNLLQALTICNLEYDKKLQIFHRYDSNSVRLFSLACAAEPGTFDLEKLGSREFSGVVIFMDLSTLTGSATLALDLFLETANLLEYELDAKLVDQNKNSITEEVITKWKDYADIKSRKFGTLDLFATHGDNP